MKKKIFQVKIHSVHKKHDKNWSFKSQLPEITTSVHSINSDITKTVHDHCHFAVYGTHQKLWKYLLKSKFNGTNYCYGILIPRRKFILIVIKLYQPVLYCWTLYTIGFPTSPSLRYVSLCYNFPKIKEIVRWNQKNIWTVSHFYVV